MIAGRLVTVAQDGAIPCSLTVAPGIAAVPLGGGEDGNDPWNNLIVTAKRKGQRIRSLAASVSQGLAPADGCVTGIDEHD